MSISSTFIWKNFMLFFRLNLVSFEQTFDAPENRSG